MLLLVAMLVCVRALSLGRMPFGRMRWGRRAARGLAGACGALGASARQQEQQRWAGEEAG